MTAQILPAGFRLFTSKLGKRRQNVNGKNRRNEPKWSEREDLNLRPLPPESSALPG